MFKHDGEDAEGTLARDGTPRDLVASPLLHRALSIRSNKSSRPAAPPAGPVRKAFSFRSLRGTPSSDLARRLIRIIKSQSTLVGAHETAAQERASVGVQLSEWGEHTGDEAVADITDKLGLILGELGDQEEAYAQGLEAARARIKAIRNTERSVQPSREGRAKTMEEIQRVKFREPESTRLVVLEQELVRAEAENLVAEAQLSNVTRKKLKEAFDTEFLATIQRAEKQLILAKHGRRLLALLDDTPLVPGDDRAPYEHGSQARQVLNDAEDDLRDWRPESDGLEMSVRGEADGDNMSDGLGDENGIHGSHDNSSSQADA
ncbi:hypothetical protein VUR80DRAFT_2054 [Thermomyces stellatus]